MAVISSRKGRADLENSGYFRLFAETPDDPVALKLAEVFSKVQAAVICNGNLLDEQIIPHPKFNSHNVIKGGDGKLPGHYSKVKIGNTVIDYLMVTDTDVHIFEIKDGDNFDTKKSKGELDTLTKMQDYFRVMHFEKEVHYHVVFWNTNDKKTVSFKAPVDPGVILTGREFCQLIQVDFDKMNEERRGAAAQNKAWVLDQFSNFL